MLHREVLFATHEEPPEGLIHFIASKDFSNVNFFPNITSSDSNYDFSNLEVYVNDTLTSQSANSISASANDDIKIVATRGKYPWFGGNYKNSINYIREIVEPFPLMYDYRSNVTSFSYCFYYCSSLTSIPAGLFSNNPNVTSFRYCFERCSSLTTIPAGLFSNNPNVTSFNGCFYECSSLTSIPTGLFDNNPNVTDFRYCFVFCSGLTSIPEGLFSNNPNVTNFSECFYYCSNLTPVVQIGSTASSVTVSDFAGRCRSKGTVYCKAGSAAYKAFNSSTDANVNVLTY